MSNQARVPTATIVALVLANLVPLCGVLFFRWDAFTLLLVYWAENVVVGLVNVLRLAMCPNAGKGGGSRALIIPFFIIHYGIFTLVHGLALVAIGDSLLHLDVSPRTLGTALSLPVVALGVSHGISFFVNFLGRGEYRTTTRTDLMFRPYARVVAMHLTVLFGAFLVLVTRQHWTALAVLVLLKVAVDLRGHLGERRKLANAPGG